MAAPAQERFIKSVYTAAKNGDFQSFTSLVGTNKQTNCNEADLTALLEETNLDFANNSIFHILLTKPKWYQRNRRDRQTAMLKRLLKEKPSTNIIDYKNSNGDTPLHLAIRNGDDYVVQSLLEADADIKVTTAEKQTALELAASLSRHDIYKQLLKKNAALQKKDLTKAYDCEQLRQAKDARLAKYKKKRIILGIVGTIMTISCPVGAVLAFHEWPLLSMFFSMFIPGAGPIIGLVAAILMGGLLFWTFYKKADKKYGAYAQEMLELDHSKAELSRLEAELEHINQQEKNPNANISHLRTSRSKIIEKMNAIINANEIKYGQEINKIDPDTKPGPKAWATKTDKVQTYLSIAAGFLCAFSGMLGVLGGVAGFVPAIAALSAVCLGIPVGGWIALGVALTVGVIGALVYAYKFQDSLIEKGEARQKMYALKKELYDKKRVPEDTPEKKVTKTAKSVPNRFADEPVKSTTPKIDRTSSFSSPPLSPAALLTKVGFHQEAGISNDDATKKKLITPEEYFGSLYEYH